MAADWTGIEVCAVLFFASATRSSLGFGEALVSVPLLALLMPVEVAAPLAVLVSITIALVAVLQDWRHIHLRSAGRLVLFSLGGIPLGLLLLKLAPEGVVKVVLGLVIAAFSVYSLAGSKQMNLEDDGSSWLFGFTAGILGGAYGMNGPPLAIYGSLRGWSPKQFRATLQGYFLPASLVGMCGYGIAGLWTARVNHFYFWSLPAVVIATLLGRTINHRLHPHRFLWMVHGGLLVIGVVLIIEAIAR
jgi:uncharacterized membrane protein YfcA